MSNIDSFALFNNPFSQTIVSCKARIFGMYIRVVRTYTHRCSIQVIRNDERALHTSGHLVGDLLSRLQ